MGTSVSPCAAAAAAVEGAMRKQNIARQQRFFEIARTRSARYKIQKYLTERGYPAGAFTRPLLSST
jgi:hypothetical protein